MAKEPQKPDEQYSEEETAKRRDEALRRALSMPHKPHKPAAPNVSEGAGKKGKRRGGNG